MGIYKDPEDLRDFTKDRLEFEGNQLGHQFDNWNDLFNIEVAIRKNELCELYKWCILSNRYLLMERQHLTDYKLFNKDEVLKMLKDAYSQGWQDGHYSNEESTQQAETEDKYINKMKAI